MKRLLAALGLALLTLAPAQAKEAADLAADPVAEKRLVDISVETGRPQRAAPFRNSICWHHPVSLQATGTERAPPS